MKITIKHKIIKTANNNYQIAMTINRTKLLFAGVFDNKKYAEYIANTTKLKIKDFIKKCINNNSDNGFNTAVEIFLQNNTTLLN